MIGRLASPACRLIVGGVFLLAGLGKLADRKALAVVGLYVSDAIPEAAGALLRALPALPAFEVALGCLLLWGLMSRTNAALGAVLLVLFLAVLGMAWARGLTLSSCGCFGVGGDTTYAEVIVRNAVLLLLCISLILRGGGPWSLDRAMRRTRRRIGTRILILSLPVLSVVGGACYMGRIERPGAPGLELVRGTLYGPDGVPSPYYAIQAESGETLAVTGDGGAFEFPRSSDQQRVIVRPPPWETTVDSIEIDIPDVQGASSVSHELVIRVPFR